MTAAPLTDINPAAPRTTIRTATGEQRTSTATAQLAISAIPTEAARTGHIIPGLTNNLLSLGKLCDAGCTAQLDKRMLRVHDKHGNLILTGHRELTGARLWRVDIANHACADPHALHAMLIPADTTPTVPQFARPAAPVLQHEPTLIPNDEPSPDSQPKLATTVPQLTPTHTPYQFPTPPARRTSCGHSCSTDPRDLRNTPQSTVHQ
jgi:hypothetical protein